MGTSKQTTQQEQVTDQTQKQTQAQTQNTMQAQEQATTNLQTFLQNFINNTSQTGSQNTTQNTTQNQVQDSTQASNQTYGQNVNQNTQQQQNQTSATNLAPFQQPVVSTYFDDLMKQYTGGGLTPNVYNGPRVAQPTPAELAARTMATNYATGSGSGFADAALGANRMLLDPNVILNPQNVPGMQATRDALTRSVTRNLTENILPQIRNSSSFAGGYGDNRQGIAEGLAIGRTNEGLAGALGNLDLGTYQAGLGAMQNALNLAPQTYNVGTSPANTLSQVGAAERGDAQANIEAGRQQFAENQATAPSNVLNILRGLMGTQGEFGGTTTQQGTATGTQTGATTGTQAGTQTGTQTGTSTGSAVGTGTTAQQQTQTGQQQSTQFSQQLASMLGISQSDLQATMDEISHGTSSTTSNTKNKSSTLQQLAAIAALVSIPFTFGATAPVAAGAIAAL